MDKSKVFNNLMLKSFSSFKDSKYAEAKQCWNLALKINPNGIYPLVGYGSLMVKLRDYKSALKYYEKALEVGSKDSRVFHEIGKIYFWTFQFEKARHYLEKAFLVSSEAREFRGGECVDGGYYSVYLEVDIHISNINELKLLGFDIFDMSQNDIPNYFSKSSYASKKYSDTIGLIGICAYRSRKFKLAEHLLNISLSCNENVLNINNLALVYFYQNKNKQAEECIRRVLYKEDGQTTLSNAAHVFLRSRKFSEGWDCYEYRDSKEKSMKIHTYLKDKIEWQGECEKGIRLYVFCEQGYGDNIQFVRFIEHFKAKKNVKIVLFTYEPLMDLFKYNFPYIEVHPYYDLNYEILSFSHYIFLASLPKIMKTTDKTIPAKGSYLKAPKANIEKMRQYILPSKKLKVGFCWEVSQIHLDSFLLRYIPLEYFLSLTGIDSVDFYSMQVGAEEKDLKPFAKQLGIKRIGKHIDAFADTFAAVSLLDIVIAPDTSLIHVAGSQGIPNWAIIPIGSDWRWFGYDEMNPWYDSGRLYHQKAQDNWKEPFQAIKMRLQSAASFHEKGEYAKRDDVLLFNNTNRLLEV